MDVKITFLNGDLEKETYVNQLEEVIAKDRKKVYKLVKFLYG